MPVHTLVFPPIEIHALIAQTLVNDGQLSSAATFLQLSKAHLELCTPILYHTVRLLDEFGPIEVTKTVFDTRQDSVATRARNLAYRQSISTIILGALPKIEVACKWETAIEHHVLSDSSGPPVLPNLRHGQLSGGSIRDLAIFLEVNTPSASSEPFPQSHPFTRILGYLCNDCDHGKLKITADGSKEWPKRHVENVVRSRMWELDTEINEPDLRQIPLSTFRRAWKRVNNVKNT